MTKKIKILISGLVQGVNFRYYIKEKANELGVFGWVKNLDNGNLEIIAQGERKNLEKLIKWCQTGPRFSQVRDLHIEWQKPQEEFKGFGIKY